MNLFYIKYTPESKYEVIGMDLRHDPENCSVSRPCRYCHFQEYLILVGLKEDLMEEEWEGKGERSCLLRIRAEVKLLGYNDYLPRCEYERCFFASSIKVVD